jgi:hypothetical protein
VPVEDPVALTVAVAELLPEAVPLLRPERDKADIVPLEVADEQREAEPVADALPVTVGAPEALPVALLLLVAHSDTAADVVPVLYVEKVALLEALPEPDAVATPLVVSMALHDAHAVDEIDEEPLRDLEALTVGEAEREALGEADAHPEAKKGGDGVKGALVDGKNVALGCRDGEVEEEDVKTQAPPQNTWITSRGAKNGDGLLLEEVKGVAGVIRRARRRLQRWHMMAQWWFVGVRKV